MEKKTLRVLILDDSADDAELVADGLRAAGYRLKTHRVQDMPGVQAALAKGPWDVLISELTLANFGAQHALDLLRRGGSTLPLIVVARKIGDADILRIMRAGARDVVRKGQLARLVPVVEREIEVAGERAQHRVTTESVREIADKHRTLIEGSREAIGYCHDGMHIDANRAYLQTFGYDNFSELEGVPILNLLDVGSHGRAKDCMRTAGQPGESQPACEFVAVRKDGTRFAVEFAVSTVRLRGETCLQVNVTDISRRKAVESRLQFLNQRDALTGLYNRHFLLQELTRTVERIAAGGEPGSLLYLDIDQLKDVNDIYGHAAGDRLLLRVARVIRDKVRDQDLVARYGGDEFVVLMPGFDMTQAEAVREMLTRSLGEVCVSEGGQTVGCRCAMSLTPVDAAAGGAHKILSLAYQSCHKAKTRRTAVSDETPPEAVVAPPAVPAASSPEPSPQPAAVLAVNRLRLAYQPVVNLQASEEESYEVLVRMEDDDQQLIAAADFIPAAERSGLMPELDRWVLRQALAALAMLHKSGKRTNFFINLSPAVLDDPGVHSLITQLLADLRLRPACVVFEVGESALADRPAEARAFIDIVRRHGCRVAIDHFGARIGAIAQLRDLPVEFLKLAGQFMDGLAQDEVNQTLVQALVHIGRSLDKRIIAKSVQDADSLSLLWRYGVDYVQGNLFQPPEAQLNYAFEDHSVSSDQAVAGWISAARV